MKIRHMLWLFLALSVAAATPEREEITVAGVTFTMLKVAPGTFTMGSPETEAGRIPERENPGRVTITQAYYLGEYEVTQELYAAVMLATIPESTAIPNAAGMYWADPEDPFADADPYPSRIRHPRNPVERTGWRHAREFITRLNLLTGRKFRLPSEAEWEYAARAGSSGAYWFGDDPATLADYAVFDAEAPLPVGSRRPNPWGFYDMYGNVWEFCRDEYKRAQPAYRFTEGADHPDYRLDGPDGGAHFQVIRGGAYSFGAAWCRSAARSGFDGWHRAPDIGFRLAADAGEETP